MMTSGLKSMICCTCFSVWPPDIGTTVQPSALGRSGHRGRR